MIMEVFDFIVIGGGSGGMAAARRAAKIYGKRVALVETGRLGGTCVNLGCVPKKIMYNAATLMDSFADAKDYGINLSGTDCPKLDWKKLKDSRDAYVGKLNGIYENNLKNDGVTLFRGLATFNNSKSEIKITKSDFGDHHKDQKDNNHINNNNNNNSGVSNEIIISGSHILIATGSHAIIPDIPGAQLGTSSDGFFDLEMAPRKVGIVGSGYVGVELAGILHSLGSSVTLWCRRDGVLSHFDTMISSTLTKEMQRVGINLNTMSNISKVEKQQDGKGLRICFNQAEKGEKEEEKECFNYDFLIWAIGRTPNSLGLGLEAIKVEIDRKSESIIVDQYQNTSIPGIYAIGDVCGVVPLTPVAIAAGRKLVDRLFGDKDQIDAKLDYTNVPSVVFSHPSPCGTIGLCEAKARSLYSSDEIRIYESSFINLYYAPLTDAANKAITKYKLVCVGKDERIVGLHMIGRSSDEILQGFATAIKMGACKKDFDNCIAIHPTASEELVTMR